MHVHTFQPICSTKKRKNSISETSSLHNDMLKTKIRELFNQEAPLFLLEVGPTPDPDIILTFEQEAQKGRKRKRALGDGPFEHFTYLMVGYHDVTSNRRYLLLVNSFGHKKFKNQPELEALSSDYTVVYGDIWHLWPDRYYLKAPDQTLVFDLQKAVLGMWETIFSELAPEDLRALFHSASNGTCAISRLLGPSIKETERGALFCETANSAAVRVTLDDQLDEKLRLFLKAYTEFKNTESTGESMEVDTETMPSPEAGAAMAAATCAVQAQVSAPENTSPPPTINQQVLPETVQLTSRPASAFSIVGGSPPSPPSLPSSHNCLFDAKWSQPSAHSSCIGEDLKFTVNMLSIALQMSRSLERLPDRLSFNLTCDPNTFGVTRMFPSYQTFLVSVSATAINLLRQNGAIKDHLENGTPCQPPSQASFSPFSCQQTVAVLRRNMGVILCGLPRACEQDYLTCAPKIRK